VTFAQGDLQTKGRNTEKKKPRPAEKKGLTTEIALEENIQIGAVRPTPPKEEDGCFNQRGDVYGKGRRADVGGAV